MTKSRFEEAAPVTTTTGRNRRQVAFHLPDVHGSLEPAVGTVSRTGLARWSGSPPISRSDPGT